MSGSRTLRWEDAAEERTVKGWTCKACGRFYGDYERGARFCCAADRECEKCGARYDPHSYCRPCADRKRDAKWEAMPRVDWDGETPLVVFDDDKYLFDEGAVDDYLATLEESGLTVEDARLELCVRESMPLFEVSEFLCDSLPEDGEVDGAEIDKAVNDWIAANVGPVWIGGGKAISIDSLRPYAAPSQPPARREEERDAE